jgi:hypothetical protein
MKNIFLMVGLVLVVINSMAALVIPDYANGAMMFGNVSIILTTAVIYITYLLPIADGFKIGYTLLFSFTGLIRLICCLPQINSSFSIFFFVAILMLEVLFVFTSYTIRNK